MRARNPDSEGYAESDDGVRIFWEVHGEGEPTLLFHYPWAISHSRAWKAQVPYLSRHCRVVVFDQRGNGRSGRPDGPAAYRIEQHARDALAVMDATGTERAALVTVSMGARASLWLAAHHPERVAGAVFIGPFLLLTPWPSERTRRLTFLEPRAARRARIIGGSIVRSLPVLARSRSYRRFVRRVRLPEALRVFNAAYLRRDQRGFLQWFCATLAIPDAHSTRQIEDAVEWGTETDAQTLIDSFVGLDIDEDALLTDRAEILAYCSALSCPVLVIHGDEDLVSPPEWGTALAEATSGELLRIEGCGHDVRGRKPVPVNLALRTFAERLQTADARERTTM